VVKNISQNIILMLDMDVERWNGQMVKLIGGNSMIIRQKDMEHIKRWAMKTDTSDNQ
jgi:hypothetical protein